MGQVKDIYFDHSEGGDAFFGRCACLLNLVSSKFASTPVHFEERVNKQRLNKTLDAVFPHFRKVQGMNRILTNCLASLLFHSEHVVGSDRMEGFAPNHAARSIPVYRDISLTEDLEDAAGSVLAWNTGHSVTGVPTYIRSLVDLAAMKSRQKELVGEVVRQVMAGVTKYFDDRRIGGGDMTEARINDIVGGALKEQFGSFEIRLEKQVQTLSENFAKATGNTVPLELVTETTTKKKTVMTLSAFGGKLLRLPRDFQFPMLGVQDLWIKWNVGDETRGIPPLRTLNPGDYSFLDKIEKTAAELRGATGKHKQKRRKTTKTVCDMKFICNAVEGAAKGLGYDASDKSYPNLVRMVEAAMSELDPKASTRGKNQHRWQTVVARVRKRMRAANDE